MKKISKILIICVISFLLIGTVTAATDMSNIKCPKGWVKQSDNWYTSPVENIELKIIKGKDKSYFENNTKRYNYYANNDGSYDYRDITINEYGCFEIVKIDNQEYIIVIYDKYNHFAKNKKKLDEYLEEINSLNNIKAIPQ